MKRILKFRVWDKRETKGERTREMLYDAQNSSLWLDFLVYPEAYELMQYTGLKDENGEEIYEGDLIQFTCNGVKNVPISVIYHGASFGCVIETETGSKEYWDLSYIVRQFYPKVIGNIWENIED